MIRRLGIKALPSITEVVTLILGTTIPRALARTFKEKNPDLFRHVMLSARGGLDAEDQEQRSR